VAVPAGPRRERLIVLPDPALVVLVGPAGSGKTTFAAAHFAPAEILSSDAFRAIISGDEANQAATRAAFSMLHREVGRRLARGQLTVVDATNVQAHARRPLLARAGAADVPAVALVFDLPPSLVQSRNANRATRMVDPGVVAGHLALLRRTVDRGVIEREGFAAVFRVRLPNEVDAVRVERVPNTVPGAPYG
jgi:protein phosphatase